MRFREFIRLESLALKGNYKGTFFQRLVAASYMLAPTMDESAVPAFQDLASKLARQGEFLKSKFQFEPTHDNPYKSMKHLTREIDKQKAADIRRPVMKVFAEPPGPEGEPVQGHPLFSNDFNVQIRGIHDAITHYMGQHPFSARGEYGAYNRHLKTLCNIEQVKSGDCPAAKAMFTEVVAQTSVFYVYGDYVVQKVVILNDYDHARIGALAKESPLNEFFVLEDKELNPRPEFHWEAFSMAMPKLSQELNRQVEAGAARSPLDRLPRGGSDAIPTRRRAG